MSICEECGVAFDPIRRKVARYCSKLCNTRAFMRNERRAEGKRVSPTYGFTDEQRLLHYRDVDEETGCWNWRGAKYKGRGWTYSNAGRVIGAHRLSAVLWLGLDASRSD